MSKQLLLGDEAIAQAALDAGLSGVYAYPGTPSTEITEYIQMAPITSERNIHCRWSVNEKTAMESALGMSFAGKRALVCMKHVGMNVAADCFINAAITGVKGGLIVLAADDPSMHSSQNEQDSRFYGDFSLIPMYEPCNQQEAYDMVYNGFEFSEKIGEPLLVRMVTRLAHSRSGVECKPTKPQNNLSFSEDPRQFILLPGNARKRYKTLLARQEEFIKASEESSYNKYTDGPNKKLGIVACGIGYNYLMENYPEGCEYPVLKIGQYPLPKKQLLQLVESCDEILVLEDGQPFVEKHLKGYLASE
ncbi:indolepyruvate oxidoreductase [Bacteroides reticulotermitis JCM 10512]|uniref:Indolepyruvate oxidoreductase n=1 Tax=Bacteroides reticulotermitis JCM 10512 TaxID=1445607 RepID=W4V055_9BACE|nr:indolepyruvate oxidoreductase [Bacteroides reticulotermitis JCM 10512]